MALMCALSAIAWGALPDRMAVHWGSGGAPDRSGSRTEGILAIPATAGIVYALMLALPRFDPLPANYARFSGAYAGLRALIVGFMAALHVVVVASALGAQVSMLVVIPLLCGLLFAGLGALLGRFAPTWFVGIRTPWTLSSEESWNKTHRLGARLFVATGAVIAVLAVLRATWVFAIMIGLVLGVVAVLAAYSYLVWRQDPQRAGPGMAPREHT